MNIELARNTNLSHYRIVSKIGVGGMGHGHTTAILRASVQNSHGFLWSENSPVHLCAAELAHHWHTKQYGQPLGGP